jgi:hypothetical protein
LLGLFGGKALVPFVATEQEHVFGSGCIWVHCALLSLIFACVHSYDEQPSLFRTSSAIFSTGAVGNLSKPNPSSTPDSSLHLSRFVLVLIVIVIVPRPRPRNRVQRFFDPDKLEVHRASLQDVRRPWTFCGARTVACARRFYPATIAPGAFEFGNNCSQTPNTLIISRFPPQNR